MCKMLDGNYHTKYREAFEEGHLKITNPIS